MKFVTVREFRTKVASVREDLQRERDIILTSNGRPFAILSSVNPDNVEEELLALRRARARLALDRIRSKAKLSGLDTMTTGEIDAVVAETRQEKQSGAKRKR